MTWKHNMSRIWLSWWVRGRTESAVVIERGSTEGIRTRCHQGYVEEGGLDFIAWISLGK